MTAGDHCLLPANVKTWSTEVLLGALSPQPSAHMQSLFHNKGGRPSKQATPGEREGLALAVAASMQWSRLRDSSNPMFFPNIVANVKRMEGTERDWSQTGR